jgi:hypothetical protein
MCPYLLLGAIQMRESGALFVSARERARMDPGYAPLYNPYAPRAPWQAEYRPQTTRACRQTHRTGATQSLGDLILIDPTQIALWLKLDGLICGLCPRSYRMSATCYVVCFPDFEWRESHFGFACPSAQLFLVQSSWNYYFLAIWSEGTSKFWLLRIRIKNIN